MANYQVCFVSMIASGVYVNSLVFKILHGRKKQCGKRKINEDLRQCHILLEHCKPCWSEVTERFIGKIAQTGQVKSTCKHR